MIFIHIVTYNSARFIEKCLRSVLVQPDVIVSVTDNASSDGTQAIIAKEFTGQLRIFTNTTNLGFCAAHNQGVAQFLNSDAEYLLILNPDVRLEANALAKMVKGFELSADIGIVTPKIFRADANLDPVEPKRLDAAGMILTNSLRHFDRGSNELDRGQFDESEFVFGGTGAALMLSRECVKDLLLSGQRFDQDLVKVYPFLMAVKAQRPELFDEAFFAYREDADLCWRASKLGWKCIYVPQAVLYHQRKVFVDNRSSIEPELNRYSVRNRFLLQINNFSFTKNWAAIIPGLLFRNLMVILGVLFKERSSLAGLGDVFKLSQRAYERRLILKRKRR